MTTCFISHSTQDAPFANFVHHQLESFGLPTFVAPIGIQPGAHWSEAIRSNLYDSSVVFFLASRAACQSPSVLMEIGGAWLSGKTIIPVIWEMSPEELPSWMNQRQAVDLRGRHPMDLLPVIGELAQQVQRQRLFNAAVLVGFAVLLFVSNSE